MITRLFGYFGAKHRISRHYPAPLYDTIVEPFAGSAGYACRYPGKRVILVDADKNVVDLWRYLIQVPAEEILSLPDILPGETVDKMPNEGARMLASCWVHSMPFTKKPGAWCRSGKNINSWWSSGVRTRVADSLPAIRHWTVIHGDYRDSPKIKGTFFVDPPYSVAGRANYKHNAKHICFETLGAWCRSIDGQAIVAENFGATWLDFEPLVSMRAISQKKTIEAVWTNTAPTQLRMFHDGDQRAGVTMTS